MIMENIALIVSHQVILHKRKTSKSPIPFDKNREKKAGQCSNHSFFIAFKNSVRLFMMSDYRYFS
jgi:hypothetical protein